MMLKVIQVLVVFTLFVAECLGRSPPVVVGTPASVDSSSNNKNKCRKDLLLMVDTSYSIGESSFNDDVKPFLEHFVTNLSLNVAKEGTRIALILFGQEDRTKIMLPFGKEYNATKIANYIKNLKWEDVRGSRTRTDVALKIAYEKIFTQHNPNNIRSNVDDVVLLITDGSPSKFDDTKKNAQVLKDKDILIIGAAIGSKRDEFFDKLKEVATKNHTVKADFDNLDKIIGTLIAKSCQLPAGCTCKNVVQSRPIPVPLGQSKVEIEWPKPSPSCQNNASPDVKGEKVSPEGITSPHSFPVGQHTVTYTFTLRGNVTANCPLFFNVTGKLCGSKAHDPGYKVCCCGKIHQKKSDHDCCGMFYYNTSSTKCCDKTDGNLVSPIKESCPSE